MGADLLSKSANFSPLGLSQIGGRRALDNFLVAALNGAIALIEVINIAKFIAQDLHFNMACTLDHPLQIALTIAKGRLCFTPAFQNFLFQFLGIMYRTHAAPTAAPAGFQHQRITNVRCLCSDCIHFIAKNIGGWNNRYLCFNRHAARARLVAQLAHGLGLRTDKGDVRCRAGIYKIGVL